MELWMEAIWKPYIQGSNRSALLLDSMESHIYHKFIDSVDTLDTRFIQIPGGFMSVSQNCDVDIIKPFKTRLVDLRQDWKEAEYRRMRGISKIPVPGRFEVQSVDKSL